MIKNTTLTYVEIFKPYKMVNFKNKWAAMLIKQSRTTTNMKKLHNCILTFNFSVFWISWLMFGRHGLRRNQLLKQS